MPEYCSSRLKLTVANMITNHGKFIEEEAWVQTLKRREEVFKVNSNIQNLWGTKLNISVTYVCSAYEIIDAADNVA